MLAGMHFNMEHVGGYGLYLPFNIIGWMFVSLLIGLGFWKIGKTGKIIFCINYYYLYNSIIF